MPLCVASETGAIPFQNTYYLQSFAKKKKKKKKKKKLRQSIYFTWNAYVACFEVGR